MEWLLNLVVVIMAILMALVALFWGRTDVSLTDVKREKLMSCDDYEVCSVAFSEYQASLRIDDSVCRKNLLSVCFHQYCFGCN